MTRHGDRRVPPWPPPASDDQRLIAEGLAAPLSRCPYGERFADDDPAHPCHAECLEEC